MSEYDDLILLTERLLKKVSKTTNISLFVDKPLFINKVEYNSSGFCVYFKVKGDCLGELQTISIPIHLYSKSIKGGMGFVLYFKNKSLYMLEGFSYDNEIINLDFGVYELK